MAMAAGWLNDVGLFEDAAEMVGAVGEVNGTVEEKPGGQREDGEYEWREELCVHPGCGSLHGYPALRHELSPSPLVTMIRR